MRPRWRALMLFDEGKQTTTMPIRTLYTPVHAGHNPPMEFLHGRHVPFFEMPRRVDMLRDGLESAALAVIETPPLVVPREVIAQAHDAAMLDYFEMLSARVLDTVRTDFDIYHMGDTVSGDVYYYESVFPMHARNTGSGRRFYIYDSTSPVGARTYEAALHSANLAYHGARALLDGERAVYALCRPPGHHAGRDFMGGYCYINNAAVAAYALKERGRVAVLDIDYHHGNGTQHILWDEPEILFASLHADPAVDYPYYCGYADERGAHGQVINVPLPHGTDAAAYLDALHATLARIRDFAPQSLVISLGFDTFKDDPIASFTLGVDAYARIGQAIAALELPTLYVQEGGYAVERLGDLAAGFFSGVLG